MTVTSMRAIFIALFRRLPQRATGNRQGFAGDAAGFFAAEEEGERGDLARFDQALLRIFLRDHPQIFFHVAALATLLDPEARADAREPGGARAGIDGVAGDAMCRALQ